MPKKATNIVRSSTVEKTKVKAKKHREVAVIIPCYNEGAGIADVIKKMPYDRAARNHWQLTVYVIDNNSDDDTAKVAAECGAIVIHEKHKGKGNAIRTGFKSLPDSTDYVVMLDGDDTYDAGEVLRMIEPLDNKFCQVVIGSRLKGKIAAGSMNFTSRVGNFFFTTIVRMFHKVAVTDVLTGYFAWTKKALDELAPHLHSHGFAIEMEMITRMARMGYDIYSVPISYTPRSGESNLRPFSDGAKILKMYFSTLQWRPNHENKKEPIKKNNALLKYKVKKRDA